jgi:23S rRNA (uracil1939-C5)-methyltransferase
MIAAKDRKEHKILCVFCSFCAFWRLPNRVSFRSMQEIELTTEKMAFEGKAIARSDRFVIFVDGALPGEKVRAVVYQQKRSFANARAVEILEPSPHRVPAPCPMFGTCGGCAFQQMAYPAQLAMKREVLLESLYGVPGVPDNVIEVIGADSPFHFRNKMVFAFGLQDGQPVLGLHRKGDWQSVVPADVCLLQSPESNEILKRTIELVKARAVPVFDEHRNEGILRHLVIREGKHTGERMIHLHAADPHPAIEDVQKALADLCTTFLLSYHRTVPEAAPAATTYVLSGPGKITERLNGFVFEIGPSTFFQTNTLQAEKLFRVVRDWAAEAKSKKAVDLYAGTGPIGIHLSAAAERVVGIESNAESVAMARRNIELNGITNMDLVCAEAEKAGIAVFPRPTDLVVVDPPRIGLHRKAVELLLTVAPPHLIYVSCNPATLARDLKLFCEAGYRVETIQPVDMFPHTFHIEAVARLRR